MAVRTIGSGGDFSSPQAWEASLSATLTEQETARVIDNLSGLTNAQKTFDINVVTSASNDIIIEGWDNVEGKVRVQDFKAGNGDIPVITYGRGGSFGLISLREGCNHITVRSLTMECTNNNSNFISGFRSTVAVDNFLIVYNNYGYVADETNDYLAIFSIEAGTLGSIHDNIFVSGNTACISLNGSTLDVYNNTIVGTFAGTSISRTGIRYNSGTTERNAVFNFGTLGGNRDYLNPAPTFNDNASHDDTGNVGFQNLALFDQYTDPANHDWTFKAGNSLEGAAFGGLDIGITAPTGGGGGFEPQWAINSNAILG